MDAWAYPICFFAAFIFALLLFRKPIGKFLDRAEKISTSGIEAGKAAKQIAESNEKPDAIENFVDPRNMLATNSLTATESTHVNEVEATKYTEEENFLRNYETPMILMKEVELKNQLKNYEFAPEMMESILLRLNAAMVVRIEFEEIYKLIFGSQIRFLELVNSYPDGMPSNLAIEVYEDAKRKHPKGYNDFPFEEWFKYLAHNGLILDVGGKYKIGVVGQEFLIWLIRMFYTKHKDL